MFVLVDEAEPYKARRRGTKPRPDELDLLRGAAPATTKVWICNECVARMAQTLAEELAGLRGCWAGRSGQVAVRCGRRDRPCRARPAAPIPGHGGLCQKATPPRSASTRLLITDFSSRMLCHWP